jgi:hypothetical protein
MKFSDLSEQQNYFLLPKIDQTELKILWVDDYWDGPKSGLLEYQCHKYWFQICHENEDPELTNYYRHFLIIDLSDEQLKEEEYWHKLFREKVGHHMDGWGINKESLKTLKPQEKRAEFYDAYKAREPLSLFSTVR